MSKMYIGQRVSFLYIGSFLVLLMWFATDPDLGLIDSMGFGASTLAMIMLLLKSIIYICLLHLARKTIFDYFLMRTALMKAMHTPEGAGLAMIAVSIMTLAISVTIYAATAM